MPPLRSVVKVTRVISLDDWRVVDYAYNTGEFNIEKLVGKYGTPPAQPVIPRLPVKSGTKEHLTRLLAMACVVREPERFGVSLPTISDEQHLVQVSISQSMPMAKAADRTAAPSTSPFRRHGALTMYGWASIQGPRKSAAGWRRVR